ncbi:hypothetical protein L1887_09311 [Cichorium endivia]|nr:hypothetical protein L1887_09311 [Cichorium endivia]
MLFQQEHDLFNRKLRHVNWNLASPLLLLLLRLVLFAISPPPYPSHTYTYPHPSEYICRRFLPIVLNLAR